ncbi:hypothetical protein EDB81DRAFT_930318 [Dactylonectria macrodidyma]|uniref:Uncharacterized protein n=1 Tax=Dactylonectria macrodidyma TaxID=307937 RepID=A0A9P9I5Y1_9HYPO|nr:hypothetical protein EDB81DRAFT_930318 [Dactylonectria macrodidyma]
MHGILSLALRLAYMDSAARQQLILIGKQHHTLALEGFRNGIDAMGNDNSDALFPFGVSNVATQATKAASQLSWTLPQSANETLQNQQLLGGVDPSVVAEVSTEEVWPPLGPYDNSGVLGGFGLFGHLPMATAGIDDVEMQGRGRPARVDGVVTDSVLNVREI